MFCVNIILFEGFESLDVFGPVELMEKVPEKFSIKYYSLNGGLITSRRGVCIETESFNKLIERKTGIESAYKSVLVIPGCVNMRDYLNNENLVKQIKMLADFSFYLVSICNGAMLLAKSGFLKEKKVAISHSMLQSYSEFTKDALWETNIPWVVSGTFYSASNSASADDMIVGFITDRVGKSAADKVLRESEYSLLEDSIHDPISMEL